MRSSRMIVSSETTRVSSRATLPTERDEQACGFRVERAQATTLLSQRREPSQASSILPAYQAHGWGWEDGL
jgi:hypothetical protein